MRRMQRPWAKRRLPLPESKRQSRFGLISPVRLWVPSEEGLCLLLIYIWGGGMEREKICFEEGKENC